MNNEILFKPYYFPVSKSYLFELFAQIFLPIENGKCSTVVDNGNLNLFEVMDIFMKNCELFAKVTELASVYKMNNKLAVLYLNEINDFEKVVNLYKSGTRFVFIVKDEVHRDIYQPRFSKIRQLLLQNIIRIPPLSESDCNYCIERQEFLNKKKLKLSQRKAILDICQKSQTLIEKSCKVLFEKETHGNTREFLESNLANNIHHKHFVFQEEKLHEVLSPKEISIVETMLRLRKHIITKDDLAAVIWGDRCAELYSENAITQFIWRLRSKLVVLGAPKNCIKTVYGRGYLLQY